MNPVTHISHILYTVLVQFQDSPGTVLVQVLVQSRPRWEHSVLCVTLRSEPGVGLRCLSASLIGHGHAPLTQTAAQDKEQGTPWRPGTPR